MMGDRRKEQIIKSFIIKYQGRNTNIWSNQWTLTTAQYTVSVSHTEVYDANSTASEDSGLPEHNTVIGWVVPNDTASYPGKTWILRKSHYFQHKTYHSVTRADKNIHGINLMRCKFKFLVFFFLCITWILNYGLLTINPELFQLVTQHPFNGLAFKRLANFLYCVCHRVSLQIKWFWYICQLQLG